MAIKTVDRLETSVMQALSAAVRHTTDYTEPIVGTLALRDVGNISIRALKRGQFFASNHTGSYCPCK